MTLPPLRHDNGNPRTSGAERRISERAAFVARATKAPRTEFKSETVTRYPAPSAVLFATTIHYARSLLFLSLSATLPSPRLFPSLSLSPPLFRAPPYLYDIGVIFVSLSFPFPPRSREVKPRAKEEEKSTSESESRYEFTE